MKKPVKGTEFMDGKSVVMTYYDCGNCGYEFTADEIIEEVERCPECRCLVDWNELEE